MSPFPTSSSLPTPKPRPQPPPAAQPPPPPPPATGFPRLNIRPPKPLDPEVYRNWRTRLRPWLLTCAVTLIVAGGALGGATLKTEWQRRKARELRALELAGAAATPSVAKTETGEKREGAAEGSLSTVTGSKAGSAVQSEREAQARNKKILEHVENLEARRRELVMKREEIVLKVQRLQERMRRKEREKMERERMGREGGGGVRAGR